MAIPKAGKNIYAKNQQSFEKIHVKLLCCNEHKVIKQVKSNPTGNNILFFSYLKSPQVNTDKKPI